MVVFFSRIPMLGYIYVIIVMFGRPHCRKGPYNRTTKRHAILLQKKPSFNKYVLLSLYNLIQQFQTQQQNINITTKPAVTIDLNSNTDKNNKKKTPKEKLLQGMLPQSTQLPNTSSITYVQQYNRYVNTGIKQYLIPHLLYMHIKRYIKELSNIQHLIYYMYVLQQNSCVQVLSNYQHKKKNKKTQQLTILLSTTMHIIPYLFPYAKHQKKQYNQVLTRNPDNKYIYIQNILLFLLYLKTQNFLGYQEGGGEGKGIRSENKKNRSVGGGSLYLSNELQKN
eukprot:TRINITY_DN9582_c1_g1_i1.p4 TRINITY_DN9582_c1_g1~~TRINITY_DN9582_c1_g1_i1.p4  ORF type:complete len:280 (+),score=-12.94 TRINITY_DN9582_c1_g1_i1:2-841(+)